MDKNVIEQYVDMLGEIEDCEKRIAESKKRLDEMEEKGYLENDIVTGGSGGIQHYKIAGFPYPRYTREKTLLLSRIGRLSKFKMELLQVTTDVEEFIASVENSRMRRILTKRFLESKSWKQVAKELGPGNTEDAVRKEVERFIK